MKMEQTESSETSAYKIRMPGNYLEESIQHICNFVLPILLHKEWRNVFYKHKT